MEGDEKGEHHVFAGNRTLVDSDTINTAVVNIHYLTKVLQQLTAWNAT